MKGVTRIYGYFNGMYPDGRYVVTAATADGTVLFSYVCNDEAAGRWMLGMDGVTRNNWERYQDLVGAFELEWVPFKETKTHQGLQRMVQAYLLGGGTPYGE